MRELKLWMWIAILTSGLALTSCTSDSNDNPVIPEEPQESSELTVEQWLAKIPGVSDVTVKKTTPTKENLMMQQTYYYFYFEQKIDHTNAAKGTFKQRVVLRYEGKDAVNVLHTQGYYTADKADDLITATLAAILNGNHIEIEYRYFGTSLPEPFENLEFNYLSSKQASEDYHAIVTALKASGHFKGQWLATGTSKSGIASALYAYYNEKNGYNDMDLYVPFCAPFCESVADPKIGKFMIENSLASMPTIKEKLLAIDREIVRKSDLSDYLVAKYKEDNKGTIKEMQEEKKTEDEIVGTILAYYVNASRNNLFDKLANIPIETLMDYIPDPKDKSTLEFTKFFIEKNWSELLEYIKEHPKAYTRAKTEADMLKLRKQDLGWAYYIQAMLELGHYRMYFDDLKPYLELTTMDHILNNDEGMLYKDYPTYAARYSDAMTKDFITNFLPKTTKKMIFVYGENDPWTGCAIPDPTNSNIQKIIVPKGGHNDFIDNEQYCPKATYQQIMTAIRKYIK